MTTMNKSAEAIAKEMEAEARRLLDIVRILKGGPFVTYPKKPHKRTRSK